MDRVLDFSQETIDSDVNPHLSEGFHVEGKNVNKTYFLKLKKNIYVRHQAAANWFNMLKPGLEDEG